MFSVDFSLVHLVRQECWPTKNRGSWKQRQHKPVFLFCDKAHSLPPEEGVSSLVDRGWKRPIKATVRVVGGGGERGKGDNRGLNDGGMKGNGGQQVLEEAAVAMATQLSWRPDSANRGGKGGVEDRMTRRSKVRTEGHVMKALWWGNGYVLTVYISYIHMFSFFLFLW